MIKPEDRFLPDAVLTAMDEISARPNPTIREAVFVNQWMPLFASPPEANVPIIDWVSVSGSWHSAVDITDDYGNIVATVPPLLETQTDPILIPPDVNLQQVVQDSITLSGISDEARANNLILNTFFNPSTEEYSEARIQVNWQHVEAWNKIYLRYGAPQCVVNIDELKKAAGGQNTGAPATSPNGMTPVELYEDI